MIYDSIHKHNPGLVRFLKSCRDRACFLEDAVNGGNNPGCSASQQSNPICKWAPFYPMINQKIRRGTNSYSGRKTTIAREIYDKRKSKKLDKTPIKIPHVRTKERNMKSSPKKVGVRKYSSLFS